MFWEDDGWYRCRVTKESGNDTFQIVSDDGRFEGSEVFQPGDGAWEWLSTAATNSRGDDCMEEEGYAQYDEDADVGANVDIQTPPAIVNRKMLTKRAPASSTYCVSRLRSLVQAAIGKEATDKWLAEHATAGTFLPMVKACPTKFAGASAEERAFQCVKAYLPAIILMNDRDFYGMLNYVLCSRSCEVVQ